MSTRAGFELAPLEPPVRDRPLNSLECVRMVTAINEIAYVLVCEIYEQRCILNGVEG